MSLCFIGALAAPAIDTWARWSPQAVWTANRERAGWPTLRPTLKSAAKLPKRVEAFFEDNFGFRDLFIRWNSFVKVFWLHQSPVPAVVIGRDGWLFYRVPGSGRDPAEYHVLLPFSFAELEAARKVLEERQAKLAAHGIRYAFVVPPDKHTVYPELLPLSFAARGPSERMSSFIRHMRRHSNVPVLDLRDDLLRAKAAGVVSPLYLRNDSHWNSHGGLVAYQAIMRLVQQWFPEAPIVRLTDFDVRAVPRPGDLALMLGMPDEWPELEYVYDAKPTIAPAAPKRAVVVADSFGWQTSSFLRYSFAYVAFQQGGFDLERVLSERPDLVIDQRLERNLAGL